jgi:hypothetical protein
VSGFIDGANLILNFPRPQSRFYQKIRAIIGRLDKLRDVQRFGRLERLPGVAAPIAKEASADPRPHPDRAR